VHVNRVGLHLRLADSLVAIAHQAIALQLPFFQSFIVRRIGRQVIWPTQQEQRAFRALCRDHFTTLFAHGSFWVNLSHTYYDNAYALGRELMCARKLGFTHLVVHAGCAVGAKDRGIGIDILVRTINKVMQYERDIVLVLENTAHGNLSVGSDINDFAIVRQKLTHPEKVRFCIDTAHAYSYGYLLGTASELESFVRYIDATLDIANIALIHLNDTDDVRGSCKDRHVLLGNGSIGAMILKQFVAHERLRHIPIILEPPVAPLDHIMESLHSVQKWHQEL